MNLRNPTEGDKFSMACFEGLRPFTLIIKDGSDAMYLSLALLKEMVGNDALANEALKGLAGNSMLLGAEKAVTEFCDIANRAGLDFPDFVKPVLIHMFDHLVTNKVKIHKLVEEHKKKKKEK